MKTLFSVLAALCFASVSACSVDVIDENVSELVSPCLLPTEAQASNLIPCVGDTALVICEAPPDNCRPHKRGSIGLDAGAFYCCE